MAKFKKLAAILLSAAIAVGNQGVLYAAQTDVSTIQQSEKKEDSQSVLDIQNIEEISETVYSDTVSAGLITNGGLIAESETVYASDYDHAHDADILNAITSLEDDIDVRGWGITKDDYAQIVYSVINDNPQIFYIKSIGCSYNSTGVVKLNFVYSYDKSQIASMQDEIDAAVKEIDAAIDTTGMSTVEIVLAYHDYLATSIAYDYADYKSNTLPSYVYNIYGAFVKNSAVCQGYSEALKYLLDRKGVICGIASSEAASHAWNIILIDGKWYHVDVTWDDPVWDNLGRATHNYFMISDATLISDASNKADYVTSVPYGYTYSTAVDKTYESGFWKNVGTYMYYYNGLWYYIEPVATDNFSGTVIYGAYDICSYDYDTGVKTVLYGPDYATWYTTIGSFYIGQYGRLAANGKYLFYSTPDKVKRYNIVTGESKDIFTLDTQGAATGYIYGLGYVNGRLCYVAKSSPGAEGVETYCDIDDLAIDSSDNTDTPSDGPYDGAVNTELQTFTYNEDNSYLSGQIVVVEWVDTDGDGIRESTVPKYKPSMQFVSTDGTETIDVFVTPTGTNTYYFDRLLAGLTEGKEYVFKVTSGDPDNVGEYKTVPVYTGTSGIGTEGKLGYIEASKQDVKFKTADDGTLMLYGEAGDNTYYGNVNSLLTNVSCVTSETGNFVSGNIVITEWINGVSTVPKTTPIMTFESYDGTEKLDVFMACLDGTNTYYFDRNLSEDMSTEKEYIFRIKLTEENNISPFKSMVATTNYMDEKSGLLWETDTQYIRYKTVAADGDNQLRVYAVNK